MSGSAHPGLAPGPRETDLLKVLTKRRPRAGGVDALIASVRLTNVIQALGGPKVQGGRCAAWYRGGKNHRSLAIDDEKGRWFDHGTQRGGGILALIEIVLGVDRAGATEWLVDLSGFQPRRANQAALRRYAERREQAKKAADELAEWR